MLKKFLQIFLGAQSVEEMKKKGVMLTLAVPALRWADWAAMGATASIVAALKVANWTKRYFWLKGDILFYKKVFLMHN